MTQTKYPELMAEIQSVADKQKHFIVKMREKVYPKLTVEEQEAVTREKKEKLKETNTEAYSRFLKVKEEDWSEILRWR